VVAVGAEALLLVVAPLNRRLFRALGVPTAFPWTTPALAVAATDEFVFNVEVDGEAGTLRNVKASISAVPLEIDRSNSIEYLRLLSTILLSSEASTITTDTSPSFPVRDATSDLSDVPVHDSDLDPSSAPSVLRLRFVPVDVFWFDLKGEVVDDRLAQSDGDHTGVPDVKKATVG